MRTYLGLILLGLVMMSFGLFEIVKLELPLMGGVPLEEYLSPLYSEMRASALLCAGIITLGFGLFGAITEMNSQSANLELKDQISEIKSELKNMALKSVPEPQIPRVLDNTSQPAQKSIFQNKNADEQTKLKYRIAWLNFIVATVVISGGVIMTVLTLVIK